MSELTEAQKIIMKAEMDEYERKQKAWSIDRAIEIARANGRGDVISIIADANDLVEYLKKTPKYFPIPNEEDAAKAVEQMKLTGEI